ncbi:MAG TPA: GIY-YIG nuclease family protein [Opitutales bacterium]|jgi:hypothetical protein|nr:GIY-YIG nuclease family protein [Opitutales bacterium]
MPKNTQNQKPGRPKKYVEFLKILKDVTSTTNTQLAKLTGKPYTNIRDYFEGDKTPQRGAIKSAVKHLAEWSIVEDKVMLELKNKSEISEHPGIFFVYDSSGNCVYIGQAKNLKVEVSARLNAKKLRHGIWRNSQLKKVRYPIAKVAAFITTYRVDSRRLRHNLEALFLRTVINQTQNSKLGKFI